MLREIHKLGNYSKNLKKDTNMTGLKGFIVVYHRLDMNDLR